MYFTRVGFWRVVACGLLTALLGATVALASPRRVPGAEVARPAVVDETVELAALPVLTAAEQEILDRALAQAAAELDHWAYTMRYRSDDEGETVARFDPSQPEDKQWELVKIEGREPRGREKVRWERRRAERDRDRPSLGELVELDGARLAAATEEELVIEVPLRSVGNDRFPPEKFRVRLTLERERAVLTAVEVSLRGAFRVAGVVRVTEGALRVEYADVVEGYPPLAVRIAGGGAGRILLVKVGGTFEAVREDFQRVEPYRDRFNVEVGELRVLDF